MSYGLVRSRWIDPDGVEPARENRLRVLEFEESRDGAWIDTPICDWLADHPDVEVESIQYAIDGDLVSALVIYREPLRADTPPPASPHAAEDDDGFAALVWAETSPGRWVGDTGDGGTLTAMLTAAIPGAWVWTAHGRLYVVGHGLAGSEDEAKRRSWRAWREFEDAQGVGSGGK